ncbi:MAG TPA: cobyric acid synthase CobQ, partial [Geminicoccaceae bacterium]|nr:cobyric acid synthase CobQ [Geminicoccaceae bacterium]
EGARRLPAEDVLALDQPPEARPGAPIRIAVPRLPRLANFDDLDPLLAEPDVAVRIVPSGEALPGDADLVILPGSKATVADLRALRAEGWDVDILAHVRRGGRVLGLCAGLQMLGRSVRDPGGAEGPPGEAAGLGLLDLDTVIAGEKVLVEATGVEPASGEAVRGYEMHLGRTDGPALARPMLRLADGRTDGAVSPDGRVMGCHLHGLFAADGFRHAFLSRLRARVPSGLEFERGVETTLDALADHLTRQLDLDRLRRIAAEVARAPAAQPPPPSRGARCSK